MLCGTTHVAQAGQSFTIKVTDGPKTVKGLLTWSGAAPGTKTITDGELRKGHTETVAGGASYHLTLRREPFAGATTVEFTAPSGEITKPCTHEGPVIGFWIVSA